MQKKDRKNSPILTKRAVFAMHGFYAGVLSQIRCFVPVGTSRNGGRVKQELLDADIKDSVFIMPRDDIILYDHDLGK